jgi:hypothetical protein
MLGGERLYAHLIDLNPPFIFWISQPAILAARLGLDPIYAFRIFVLVVLSGSLVLAWPVVRDAKAIPAGYVLTAFLLPVVHFGEREHLMLGLLMPYVAVAVARASVRPVRNSLALAAGILAGAGMALKPPALLVLMGLIAVGVYREHSPRVIRLPEHAGAVLAASLAVISILLFAPTYLLVVREYGPLYAEFSRATVAELAFRHPYALTIIAALGVAVLFRAAPSVTSRAGILWWTTAALFLSALAQWKGFGYHYLPAYGFSIMLLIDLAVSTTTTSPLRRTKVAAAWLILIVGIAPGIAFAIDRASGRDTSRFPEQVRFASTLGLAPGTRVAMLSPRLADTYPMLLESRLEHVLSSPHLWFASVTVDTAAASRLWRRTRGDIAEKRPRYVILRAPTEAERRSGDLPTGYLDRLCTDDGSRDDLQHYGLSRRSDGYEVYADSGSGRRLCPR